MVEDGVAAADAVANDDREADDDEGAAVAKANLGGCGIKRRVPQQHLDIDDQVTKEVIGE